MAHHVEAIEFARPVAPRHLARVFLQSGAAMRADSRPAFALDMVPHWGKWGSKRRFLRVAVPDRP